MYILEFPVHVTGIPRHLHVPQGIAAPPYYLNLYTHWNCDAVI